MAEHNDLGKKGEELAKQYLISLGHHILVSNWRYQKEEIDIISRIGDLIVFTEVKTRAFMYEEPADLISNAKQRNLIDAADAYLQMHNIDIEGRFDLIFVLIDGLTEKIEHFEEAFNSRT